MAVDYSTLSEEKKAVARKVYASAIKYGLDPDFVIPMVMAESSFVHGPSGRKNKDGTPVYHDNSWNIVCGLDEIEQPKRQ